MLEQDDRGFNTQPKTGKSQQKKDKGRILAMIMLIASTLLFCCIAAFAAVIILKMPLGGSMQLGVVEKSTATPQAPAVQGAEATPTRVQPTPTTQASVCGTGAQLILFNGIDFTEGVWPKGADSVRLVKIDYDHKKITVIAFPRDLWVKTPGLAVIHRPEEHLGLAYYYKYELTQGTTQQKSTEATAQIGKILLENFDVLSQNYLTLDLRLVPGMIETIGGVDITVPQAFTSDARVNFPAGPQKLNGQLSSEFVRTWDPGGEISRFDRQELFMKGVQDRMLNANILVKMPDLIKQFQENIVTDLNTVQLLSIACMSKEVTQQQIVFHEIKGDLVKQGPGYTLYPEVDKVKAKLEEWLNQ